MTIPRVLSIAGSDPSGGAGSQADVKSIAANGGYAMAAITALTVQNTQGVRGVHVPPADFLTDQLDALSDDITIDAVKIGMLASVEVVAAVGEWLGRVRPPVVVLDPVMVATSGDRLLDPAAERAVLDLLDRVDLITPNVPELGVLVAREPARTWPQVLDQARHLSRTHSVAVLAKGGHLSSSVVTDAFVDTSADPTVVEFAADRLDTTNTHGTGCALSSAVATLRPQCPDWPTAIAVAKAWLTRAISAGGELRVGGGQGPIHHFTDRW